jgi:hypothetical protein
MSTTLSMTADQLRALRYSLDGAEALQTEHHAAADARAAMRAEQLDGLEINLPTGHTISVDLRQYPSIAAVNIRSLLAELLATIERESQRCAAARVAEINGIVNPRHMPTPSPRTRLRVVASEF